MKATAKWTMAAAAVASLMGATVAQAGSAYGLGKRSVAYQTIEQGADGLWCEPTVVAVESAAGWDEMMQNLAAAGVLMVLPAPAAPELDWSDWMVVLVSMGAQSRRGAGLEVTGANVAGRSLHLDVSLKAPNGGMSSDPYMPYVVVAVQKNRVGKTQKVQLHYTLETPDSYMSADANLPTEAAVYQVQQVTQLTWGRMKADYR